MKKKFKKLELEKKDEKNSSKVEVGKNKTENKVCKVRVRLTGQKIKF